MTDQQLTDKTGAAVAVALDEERNAYAITLADGEVAGRAFFTPASGAEDDWIFFHTEVDESYGGRGLGGILVGEAVADAARRGKTVVPVCPFVAKWVEKNGEEYASSGGTVRKARPADLDTAKAASKEA